MKIGRPKKFDEDIALQAAMMYFWQNGYDNASLSELLNVMQIKKSSFYQTFESKEKLFIRTLDLYVNGFINQTKANLSEENAKAILVDMLRNAFHEIETYGELRGCLLMNSGSECYKKYPQLSSLIASHFKGFHDLFTLIIEKAKANGDIANSSASSMIASNYLSNLSGLVALVKNGADESVITEVKSGDRKSVV